MKKQWLLDYGGQTSVVGVTVEEGEGTRAQSEQQRARTSLGRHSFSQQSVVICLVLMARRWRSKAPPTDRFLGGQLSGWHIFSAMMCSSRFLPQIRKGASLSRRPRPEREAASHSDADSSSASSSAAMTSSSKAAEVEASRPKRARERRRSEEWENIV
ncbi:hypothetical protein PMAYCL1PPCAC_08564 [Pristionchus mayeri]|uniref:Uncharacterized protein n=1 Tax=Pristionchus mayeri TaxID=1317129 RepID=A0AAN4ZF26_9BILA|nr:hypothetical protein PMAYCL1PPCAC_08564 [Pristionchus mayeri]